MEYLKVLRTLLQHDIDILAITERGKEHCLQSGALRFHTWKSIIPWREYERVIVCVPIEGTPAVLSAVLKNTKCPVLFEKPGFLSSRELGEFVLQHSEMRARAYVAFNRIYFPSVRMAKEIVSQHELVAIQSDMTEWVSNLDTNSFPLTVLKRWGIANSIHMLSTMLYLFPDLELDRRYRRPGSRYEWHPSGDAFSGACTVGARNVPLQDHASWVGAGRFSLGLVFREFSLRLSPLHHLVRINQYTEEEELHLAQEPTKLGFLQMIEDFIGERWTLKEHCSIERLDRCIQLAEKIFFYDDAINPVS